ncbi:MAG: hypothetical protein GC137_10495 [Alphaproteobacteria bacterium]|nr:hypothetical protein [Alphaproteobacteria bacterium]
MKNPRSSFNDAVTIDGYVHTWEHEFASDMSKQELDQIQAELQRMADFFDINVDIEQTENGFKFGFETFKDYAWFRKSTHNMAPTEGEFTHTQIFENRSPEYQEAWIKGMRDSIEFYGIDCEIEEKDGEVAFKFNNFDDYAWIGGMIEDGFADHKAGITLQHMRMAEQQQSFFPSGMQ